MHGNISQEFIGCSLGDKRLDKRLVQVSEQLYSKIGSGIPTACSNWASTKAAYRLLDHEDISENSFIEGHIQSTTNRFDNNNNKVLVLHDTTEFSYKMNASSLGILKKVFVKKKPKDYFITTKGILMHLSLAITTSGLPLGISAVKFWSRKKFKGTAKLKSHVNPTRVPIEQKESVRWIQNIHKSNEVFGAPKQLVHIGDREADIFELFSECIHSGSSFVIRLCVNRCTKNSKVKLFETTEKLPAAGIYQIVKKYPDGKKEKIPIEIRFKKVEVQPPIGKEKRYNPISGFYIEAKEKIKSGTRKRSRINWKILTNIPIDSYKDAFEKIKWYSLRWKIETFFKILKSGCKTETSKLRTSNRLAKYISICCVISWKIFWLSIIYRTNPDTDFKNVFTKIEQQVLQAIQNQSNSNWKGNNIADYYEVISKLGGHMGRQYDQPPGNMVTWRGLSRLNDIIIGYMLGVKNVGN